MLNIRFHELGEEVEDVAADGDVARKVRSGHDKVHIGAWGRLVAEGRRRGWTLRT